MPKETTYQRLKRENQELKQKLIILASAPESEEGMKIIMDVRMSKDIESAIWAGNITGKQNEGLINVINTWGKQSS